jgi:hypothetical protein
MIPAMDLDLVAAEWEAGLLPPERIPAVAVRLMEVGLDSSSLRLAAGLLPSETAEAHRLFGAALRELGVPRERSEEERGVALAVEYARRMIRGEVDPYQGARTIWQLAVDHFDNETYRRVGNLDALIILADEWEQLPDRRSQIEHDMHEHARQLLMALDQSAD